MHSQHKNLIENIKEVLPKEETRNSPDGSEERRLGYNECLYKVYRSLPQVMEVIKGEIDKRMLSFFAKYSIDRPIPPSEIRKEWEDIITLLSEEDK